MLCRQAGECWDGIEGRMPLGDSNSQQRARSIKLTSMFDRVVLLIALLATSAVSLLAQSPNLEPQTKNPALPIVTFDFVLPGATPPHYSIAVEPDGKATYRGDEAAREGSVPMPPSNQQFTVSEPTRKQIFDLAMALNCFQGDFEYHGSQRVANMGSKSLKCTYAGRESQTTFNYSTNPQLQQLTTIFQNMGNTLQYGQRLQYLHRYDKLGMEAELKSMEDAQKNKRLAELQAIQPQLQQIVDDSSIMNVSRHRAEHLLRVIKANPAASAAAPQ